MSVENLTPPQGASGVNKFRERQAVADHLLDARHEIAAAAGMLANAGATVARTLAWRPENGDIPITKSYLQNAISEAERAVDALKSARTRLEIAYTETAEP